MYSYQVVVHTYQVDLYHVLVSCLQHRQRQSTYLVLEVKDDVDHDEHLAGDDVVGAGTASLHPLLERLLRPGNNTWTNVD